MYYPPSYRALRYPPPDSDRRERALPLQGVGWSGSRWGPTPPRDTRDVRNPPLRGPVATPGPPGAWAPWFLLEQAKGEIRDYIQ